MQRIDQIHASYPYYGSRRLVYEVFREGYEVGRKRVQRLLRLMGIRAVYPKPGTSQGAREAARYPYLLKESIYHKSEPSVGLRHHLYPNAEGLSLLSSDNGLVQPQSTELASVQHVRARFLSRGLGRGIAYLRIAVDI